MKNIAIVLAIILSFLSQKTFAQQDVNACNVYDLMIVLDRSHSVGDNFPIACRQLMKFFQNLNIAPEAVWAGFMVFNHEAKLIQHINGSKESLVHAAEIMAADSASWATDLQSALYFAHKVFQESSRWEKPIPKICVVISDGDIQDCDQGPTLEQAWLLKQDGITIHVVGIATVHEYFLRELSTGGVISFSEYENLEKTLNDINMCQ